MKIGAIIAVIVLATFWVLALIFFPFIGLILLWIFATKIASKYSTMGAVLLFLGFGTFFINMCLKGLSYINFSDMWMPPPPLLGIWTPWSDGNIFYSSIAVIGIGILYTIFEKNKKHK